MLEKVYEEIKSSFECFNKLIELIDSLIETSGKAQEQIRELERINEQMEVKHQMIVQQLVDSLADMVWAKSVPDYKYIYANKAINELLLRVDNPIGMTDDEIQSLHAGRPSEVVCNASDIVVYNEYLKRVETGATRRFTLNFLEHLVVNGKDMYLEVRKSPMFDHQGQLVAIVGSGRITNYAAEKAAVQGITCQDGHMPICKQHLLAQVNKYYYEPNTSKQVSSFNVDNLINQFKVSDERV